MKKFACNLYQAQKLYTGASFRGFHVPSAVLFRDVPSLPPRNDRDPIITALRSSKTLSHALKVIGVHASHMEPEHVVLSLRTLCSLVKNSQDVTENSVARSEEFMLLCRRMKKQITQFEVNDVMDAFKTVTLLKVPHNSVITMKLLHMIKNDINVLNISQIMFLSFLLRNYEGSKNPVIDALKIALPVVFEANLRTKLDRNNVSALTEALVYCARNEMAVSRQAKDYIVDALCGLDQLDWVTMDPRRARSIALAVIDLSTDSPSYETVYRDSIDLVTQHMGSFSFNEIDVVLGAILRFMKRAPYLIRIPVFEAAADTAVRNGWNFLECCITLRKLNYLGVVSRKLLDHMTEKIMDDPESFKDGKFGMVKTYVCGLSTANYKTDHWNLLKDLLPASRCLQNISTKEPWMNMLLELASLDIYQDAAISEVFSQEFLDQYLSREYNKLDMLMLLRLSQAVSTLHPSYRGQPPSVHYLREAKAFNGINVTEMPLRAALEMELGSDKVLSRCKTDSGIFIDHVVVVKPDGQPDSFPEGTTSEDFTHIDKLAIPEDRKRVAIVLLAASNYNSLKQLRGHTALSTRVLEASGYAVVNISHEEWSSMPDWEKVPYIIQQIKIKSGLLREDLSVSE